MPSSRIQVGINSLGWEVFHHPVVDDQPAIPIQGALQDSILFHNLITCVMVWFQNVPNLQTPRVMSISIGNSPMFPKHGCKCLAFSLRCVFRCVLEWFLRDPETSISGLRVAKAVLGGAVEAIITIYNHTCRNKLHPNGDITIIILMNNLNCISK